MTRPSAALLPLRVAEAAVDRPGADDVGFLDGGGRLGRLIADFEWSSTSLGPIAAWPPALRATASLIVRAPTAMVLLWGKDGLMLYNDSYAAIAGRRHPAILGSRAVDAFPEIAAFNRQVIEVCLGGGSLSYKDRRFILARGDVPEEIWLDLDYSPVLDEAGRPAGVLAVVLDTTARNVADERLRIAQDAARFGAFEWVPRQHLVVASDAYRKIFGLPLAGEVSEQALLDLVVPEDLNETGMLRLDQPGNPLAYSEYRIRHGATGELRWIARRGEILQDGNTLAARYLGVAWDITDRKCAELQQAFLASLGQQLQDIGDPSRVIATAARMLGTYLDVGRVGYGEMNDAGTHLVITHGWDDGTMPYFAGTFRVDEFGGRNLRLVRSGVILRLDDVLADQELSAPEVQAAHQRIGVRAMLAVPLLRDGGFAGVLFAHCAYARGWKDVDEAVAVAVVGRIWDAVQRARAEQRLRDSLASLARLNATLEERVEERTRERDRIWALSRDPLLIADMAGIWLSVSPTWTALLGWTQAELVGRTAAWMAHPDDPPLVLIDQRAAELPAGRIESRFRARDGGYRWFSWTAVVEAGLLYGVARDVTAEKAAAERLRQAEEALRQSQKMEAIGQLTGGIAHDFNNLLAGIQGGLELARRRLASGRTGEVDGFMAAAMASSQRAALLTHRLLAFARRQSLDEKSVPIGPLVLGMVELLERTLGKQVQLHLSVPPDIWPVRTDPNQLESAFLNLAINARDAMPGGGRLTIETANAWLDRGSIDLDPALPPGDYVVIAITDTGQGMPKAVQERAFEPFFTTKPVGQGTGLGLSMVHGFVHQSGGAIRIDSAPGRGTTVKLILKRARPPDEVAAAASGQEPRGAGETVLVVEDDPSVRMLVIEALRDLGYQTLEATDAQSALPILSSGVRIDLMVSDVGLPGLNGRQLADLGHQRRPGLKVLFLTGYAEQAATRGGFLAPGMEMLTKPYAIETLAAKINEMIRPA